MKTNDVKEMLQPYFDEGLVRIVYDNSEVIILNVAEREYVSVYKCTAAESVWGLLIPNEDLKVAAEKPYEMFPRYTIDLSCKNQVVLFDDDFYQKALELKKQTEEDGISSDVDHELEKELQEMMLQQEYDHSQNMENDKNVKPAEKTFRKCIVTDHVNDSMVKEDLNLNEMGLVRTIILWLLIAVCLYQFGRWIPSLERILEILCAVCIFKAGTELFLLPKRKKEGSKAKIRIQYHICLKKFYANTDGNPKIFILTDCWDVFDVTNITNNQVLWEGDRIGYVFVDGRMVKDFFYIVNHKEKN